MDDFAYIAKAEDRAGYKELLQKELAAHICPLCPAGLKMGHNVILKSINGWNLILNEFAYAHTKVHALIIPDAHQINLTTLSSVDMESVRLLAIWAIDHFHIKGGALTLRFGDAHYSGASVRHLHFHIITPEHDENIDDNAIVSFAIGLKEGRF